ncbi:MAG TPA: ArsA-related P-loop ATPase, partial [Candidatus Limnocylindria bacterium]|nr:ArsA-related P-loop ATPase [Candidatus Limnocylindria bacterium]
MSTTAPPPPPAAAPTAEPSAAAVATPAGRLVDGRPLVETSMARYAEEHPGLRYTFFGGKGGVGKTVMAAMTAVHLARSGRRVLLASTNPVHSLSGCLGQDCFGRETPV